MVRPLSRLWSAIRAVRLWRRKHPTALTAGFSAAVLLVVGVLLVAKSDTTPADVSRSLGLPWWLDDDDQSTADEPSPSPSPSVRSSEIYLFVGPPTVSSGSPTAPPTPTTAPGTVTVVATARLQPGMELTAGRAVRSGNGTHLLRMQPNGEVVLTAGSSVLWSSQTGGNLGASLVMQRDGNLVVYSARRATLWSTQTSGNPGAFLKVDDGGGLTLLSAANQPLWDRISTASLLRGNQALTANQQLTSPDGRHVLRMRSDGNLTLTASGSVRFTTGTAGNPGARLFMQNDGNLVLVATDGRLLFSSGTTRNPGAFLRVENSGRIAIVSVGGQTVWRRP